MSNEPSGPAARSHVRRRLPTGPHLSKHRFRPGESRRNSLPATATISSHAALCQSTISFVHFPPSVLHTVGLFLDLSSVGRFRLTSSSVYEHFGVSSVFWLLWALKNGLAPLIPPIQQDGCYCRRPCPGASKTNLCTFCRYIDSDSDAEEDLSFDPGYCIGDEDMFSNYTDSSSQSSQGCFDIRPNRNQHCPVGGDEPSSDNARPMRSCNSPFKTRRSDCGYHGSPDGSGRYAGGKQRPRFRHLPRPDEFYSLFRYRALTASSGWHHSKSRSHHQSHTKFHWTPTLDWFLPVFVGPPPASPPTSSPTSPLGDNGTDSATSRKEDGSEPSGSGTSSSRPSQSQALGSSPEIKSAYSRQRSKKRAKSLEALDVWLATRPRGPDALWKRVSSILCSLGVRWLLGFPAQRPEIGEHSHDYNDEETPVYLKLNLFQSDCNARKRLKRAPHIPGSGPERESGRVNEDGSVSGTPTAPPETPEGSDTDLDWLAKDEKWKVADQFSAMAEAYDSVFFLTPLVAMTTKDWTAGLIRLQLRCPQCGGVSSRGVCISCTTKVNFNDLPLPTIDAFFARRVRETPVPNSPIEFAPQLRGTGSLPRCSTPRKPCDEILSLRVGIPSRYAGRTVIVVNAGLQLLILVASLVGPLGRVVCILDLQELDTCWPDTPTRCAKCNGPNTGISSLRTLLQGRPCPEYMFCTCSVYEWIAFWLGNVSLVWAPGCSSKGALSNAVDASGSRWFSPFLGKFADRESKWRSESALGAWPQSQYRPRFKNPVVHEGVRLSASSREVDDMVRRDAHRSRSVVEKPSLAFLCNCSYLDRKHEARIRRQTQMLSDSGGDGGGATRSMGAHGKAMHRENQSAEYWVAAPSLIIFDLPARRCHFDTPNTVDGRPLREARIEGQRYLLTWTAMIGEVFGFDETSVDVAAILPWDGMESIDGSPLVVSHLLWDIHRLGPIEYETTISMAREKRTLSHKLLRKIRLRSHVGKVWRLLLDFLNHKLALPNWQSRVPVKSPFTSICTADGRGNRKHKSENLARSEKTHKQLGCGEAEGKPLGHGVLPRPGLGLAHNQDRRTGRGTRYHHHNSEPWQSSFCGEIRALARSLLGVECDSPYSLGTRLLDEAFRFELAELVDEIVFSVDSCWSNMRRARERAPRVDAADNFRHFVAFRTFTLGEWSRT